MKQTPGVEGEADTLQVHFIKGRCGSMEHFDATTRMMPVAVLVVLVLVILLSMWLAVAQWK